MLKRIAPHLVHPLPFLYPVFEGESLIKVRAGLTVFDFLADVNDEEKHENLTPDEVRERLPGLRDPLKGGVGYLEYMTDDARLTMENALSAALHGAAVANWTRLVELSLEDGRVTGATVEDSLTGTRTDIDARLAIELYTASTIAKSAFATIRSAMIVSRRCPKNSSVCPPWNRSLLKGSSRIFASIGMMNVVATSCSDALRSVFARS